MAFEDFHNVYDEEKIIGRQPKVISLVKMYPGYGFQGGGAEKSLESLNLSNRNAGEEAPIDIQIVVLSTPDNKNGGDASPVIASSEASLINDLLAYNDGMHILHFWDDFILPRNLGLATALIEGWKGPIVYRVVGLRRIDMLTRLMEEKPNLVNRITKYVVMSAEMQEGMSHIVADSQIAYIPNAVDPNIYFPANSNDEKARLKDSIFGLADNSTVFLSTGRIFSIMKGISELLNAWKQSRVWESGSTLLLVGEKRPNDYNHELDFGNLARLNIRIVPLIQDTTRLAEVYRMADVYISSSLEEGMSRSILEALASGIPVIARAGVSGNAQLVGNDAGVLFQSFPDFVARISELNQDSALRDELGARAREKVLSEYTMDTILKHYISLYKQLT